MEEEKTAKLMFLLGAGRVSEGHQTSMRFIYVDLHPCIYGLFSKFLQLDLRILAYLFVLKKTDDVTITFD